MFKNVLPAITVLFAGAKQCRKPVNFSWRLVRRKKRPFLLLPEKSGSASDSFQLYSAHRPLAKLWRSLVPLVLRTPAAKFFGRVAIEADTDSEFMQFLAQQSGLLATQLPTPAIKFGGVVGKTKRLVLLLCDAGGHPIRVVKVGLNPAGRAATEREAALLTRLPKDVIGCTGITGRISSDTFSAFATAYYPGASLDNDVGIEKLFHDWLNNSPPEPIGDLATWRELESVARRAGLPQWPMLRDALAEQTVRTTIYHGDFAPRSFVQKHILVLMRRVGNIIFGEFIGFGPGAGYFAGDQRRPHLQKQGEDDQPGQAEPEGIHRLGLIALFWSGHRCQENERQSYPANGIRQD
jgi:hypothetical protein